MKTVTGFNTDIEGSVLTDFFHPSDNRRSIHCLKTRENLLTHTHSLHLHVLYSVVIGINC